MKIARCLFTGLVAGTLLGMSSCTTTSSNQETDVAQEADGSGVDVGFLLSMNYEEARKLGQRHLDMSPYCRIVADDILVLKQTSEGVPLKVRAKGRVFLEMEAAETMVALGQEAYVDRAFEVILRGRPLLRRGNSMVEGLGDDTVFYVNGTKLQAIGKHRLLTRQEPTPEVMMAGNGGGRAQGRPVEMGTWNVMPTWRQSWQQGPNPLLPALSPEDVPSDMRPAPLLPPNSDEEAQPRLPGEAVSPANGGTDDQGSRTLGRRLGEEKPSRLRRVQ